MTFEPSTLDTEAKKALADADFRETNEFIQWLATVSSTNGTTTAATMDTSRVYVLYTCDGIMPDYTDCPITVMWPLDQYDGSGSPIANEEHECDRNYGGELTNTGQLYFDINSVHRLTELPKAIEKEVKHRQ